ncbi:SpoIID/LytB domain-containing protein [Nocardioides sp.]|uniref:SpoIID/LytB domain-containing protein n=1 Tax=Nocardioides sp. TaxID=35761 RepID=UPI002ED68314
MRSLLASGCAVAVALALTPLSAAPAAAAQRWDVPKSASITIKGHGYGHGRGMSQYGAEGAARQGLGYRQIASFYYPGTSWGRARGRIRVLLTADTTDDLIVRARSGLQIRDEGAGTTDALPDNGATRWRVIRAKGTFRVSFLRQRWRRWRVLEGRGTFLAGGEPMTLVTPTGDRPYRGRLTAVQPPGSSGLVTVNVLPLEAYLRGVVPLEIPALWSRAAVRAQAVAARTYAAYERAHPRSAAYDICDTWSCQVYGGAAAEHPNSDAAIAATKRRVLQHGGEPAFTQFGSSSGGWTVAGGVTYLPAKADPYDGWSGNPNHDWKLTVTDRRLESAFPSLSNLRRIVVVSRDGNGQWGGRVDRLRLVGSRDRVTVSGDAMRSALGLKSTWVTFRVR